MQQNPQFISNNLYGYQQQQQQQQQLMTSANNVGYVPSQQQQQQVYYGPPKNPIRLKPHFYKILYRIRILGFIACLFSLASCVTPGTAIALPFDLIFICVVNASIQRHAGFEYNRRIIFETRYQMGVSGFRAIYSHLLICCMLTFILGIGRFFAANIFLVPTMADYQFNPEFAYNNHTIEYFNMKISAAVFSSLTLVVLSILASYVAPTTSSQCWTREEVLYDPTKSSAQEPAKTCRFLPLLVLRALIILACFALAIVLVAVQSVEIHRTDPKTYYSDSEYCSNLLAPFDNIRASLETFSFERFAKTRCCTEVPAVLVKCSRIGARFQVNSKSTSGFSDACDCETLDNTKNGKNCQAFFFGEREYASGCFEKEEFYGCPGNITLQLDFNAQLFQGDISIFKGFLEASIEKIFEDDIDQRPSCIVRQECTNKDVVIEKSPFIDPNGFFSSRFVTNVTAGRPIEFQRIRFTNSIPCLKSSYSCDVDNFEVSTKTICPVTDSFKLRNVTLMRN